MYVCNVDSLYDNIDVISMKCTRHTYNLYICVCVSIYIVSKYRIIEDITWIHITVTTHLINELVYYLGID